MNTIKINAMKTKIIAHRGLSGIERENTAAAFVAAGNRNYFGIETDIHKTFDGRYIIIHNDSTDGIAEINLPVEKSNFDTLRALRLKDYNGNPRMDLCLPDLEEYLHICACYGKRCVLELKNRFSEYDIKKVIEIAEREYSTKMIIFISFDYENLVQLRKLSKEVFLQWLCGCEIDGNLIGKLKEYNLDLDIDHNFLTEENIALLHRNGINVNCWTVDDAVRANKLISWGVDYITTNILENRYNSI